MGLCQESLLQDEHSSFFGSSRSTAASSASHGHLFLCSLHNYEVYQLTAWMVQFSLSTSESCKTNKITLFFSSLLYSYVDNINDIYICTYQ